MTGEPVPFQPRPGQDALGLALRRAQAGYRRQLNDELATAGFDRRRFPDGRVLVMCAAPGETTISGIGRGLGITRQGASKIVAGLRERGYLEVTPSAADGREKILTLTSQAVRYLQAMRAAAGTIEARLLEQLGAEALGRFFEMLDLVAGGEPVLLEGGLPVSAALLKLRWRDGQDRGGQDRGGQDQDGQGRDVSEPPPG
ncbi:MAG TPA: MarR family winged helix-turn-helix transcriptional regulator [Streptosporangiaceae bacterium]|nr:MarR family winged helix-turn-helix transcriptional regulator [Streptosporangiaceae bacterium]